MRVVHFCVWEEGEKQVDFREASTYGKWSTAYESDANCSWSKALRGCGASMKARFFSITRIVLGNWKPLPLIFNMRKQTLPEAKRLTFFVHGLAGIQVKYTMPPRVPPTLLPDYALDPAVREQLQLKTFEV
jgi:hypothetical protein